MDHTTKYSVKLSKVQKPRDTAHILRRTNVEPALVATRSDKMAELARDYHDSLQDDPSEDDPIKKAADIAHVLSSMPPAPEIPEMSELGKNLEEEDTRNSIDDQKRGVAPGIDGIPAELWEGLDEIFTAGQDSPAPDPLAPPPTSPVDRATLLAPITKGGRKMLDIEARNDAIHIMTLKSYLELNETARAAWCSFADKIFANHDKSASTVQPGSHINQFLQNWSAKDSSSYPAFLQGMLTVAKKYGVTFDTPDPPQEIRNLLPLWHHNKRSPGLRQLENSPQCKCLRRAHGVTTVGQGALVAERLSSPTHVPLPSCICEACVEDRVEHKCKNPHRCATTAQARIAQLPRKWDPRTVFPPPLDAPSATSSSQAFVPPPAIVSLSEGFRIFTKISGPQFHEPLRLPAPAATPDIAGSVISLGTHCTNLGTLETLCAAGIWFENGDPRNSGVPLPATASNGLSATIAAALLACRAAPRDKPLTLVSTSSALPTAMNTHLLKWENSGWIGVPNPDPPRALAAALRARTAPTTFTKATGTTASSGCAAAASLARDALLSAVAPDPAMFTPPQSAMKGAKLSAMTQALAYRAIRDSKPVPTRKATVANVSLVRDFMRIHCGNAPRDESIWLSVRHRDFSRQIRNFLWKSVHGAHRVGRYWSHIPGYEARAVCQHCDVEESLQHIFLECTRTGREVVWKLASDLWKLKTGSCLPAPSMGSILSCGMTEMEPEIKSKPSGLNRLYRILVSESVYLIWLLRNESVITNEGAAPSANEVHNRWVFALNDRLEVDKSLACSKAKSDRSRTAPALVRSTWQRTLLNENKLPPDWLSSSGVLVGIATLSSRALPPASSRRPRHS
ncbi:hypothetical protein B0H15DRAFT_807887 [Mycena belliarum]|uniref:Reverse transcriptase zinc-binding domain-containing protein n=1 Tax=Mycena belliarum TaxID=1033014 RepID=A0AAD6TPN3_9AGAR|nr:hypothetical protein B0H15DRAFT_807887 [Mycena belliae]